MVFYLSVLKHNELIHPHTYIHSYIHAYIHTSIHPSIHPSIHTFMKKNHYFKSILTVLTFAVVLFRLNNAHHIVKCSFPNHEACLQYVLAILKHMFENCKKVLKTCFKGTGYSNEKTCL